MHSQIASGATEFDPGVAVFEQELIGRVVGKIQLDQRVDVPAGMKVMQARLHRDPDVHERVGGQRRKVGLTKRGQRDRERQSAQVPLEFGELTQVRKFGRASFGRERGRKILTVFGDARPGGRLIPYEAPRRLGDKRRPDQPDSGRKPIEQRRGKAGMVVPMVNRETRSRIAATHEPWRDRRVLPQHHSLPDARLDVSERGHGAVAEAPAAAARRPRRPARPHPATWQAAGCRCPIR